MKKILLLITSLFTFSFSAVEDCGLCTGSWEWQYTNIGATTAVNTPTGTTPASVETCYAHIYQIGLIVVEDRIALTDFYDQVTYHTETTRYSCVDECPVDKPYIDDTGVCISEPPGNPCPDGEYTDIYGNCEICPINETVNSTYDGCECNPPMALFGTQCIDPSIDSDGDSVPDGMDAFPTNPNESSDNDGDSIGDNADTDDDNDGYSDAQEAREGTNPNDASSNGSSAGGGAGTEPDGGGDNNGVDAYEDCPYGYEPASDYATTANCQPINNNEEDCSVLSSRHFYTFQMITDATSCDIAIRSSPEGRGWKDFLPNCSQGDYACYFNNTVGENDNNVSNTDSNLSDSFDDSGMLDGMQKIENVNKSILGAVGSVNDSINKQTDTLGNKLDKVITNDLQNSNKLNDTINGQTNTLGSKLDSLKSAIDSKQTFAEEIEIEGEFTFDDAEVTSMLNNHSSGISASFDTFISDYSGDILSLHTITLPVAPSCGCTDIPMDINLAGHQFNETIEICSSLDSLFAVMRPLLWFAFLVTTLFHFFRKD